MRADPKKRTSRSRTLCAKIARKNCKSSGKLWRAACTEVACTQHAQRKKLMLSLKLLNKLRVRCHRKSARSASRSRKVLRRNRAKDLQNSWKFGAPRAQYLRAIGQCALRKPRNFVAAVCRVGRAFKCKKRESAAVESTQIFHRIRAKELRTSRNFGESRAQKTMPELGQRALRKPENIVNS